MVINPFVKEDMKYFPASYGIMASRSRVKII
jgi:hypothetical protein